MKNSTWLLVLLLALLFPALADADGGTIRVSRTLGNLRVTVFTTPTPLRAGLVDISVFVQDTATGQARPEIPIMVHVQSAADPDLELSGAATPEAATNKLFRAVQLKLPVAGRWTATIDIADPEGSQTLNLDLEVGEPVPSWVSLALWIGWPVIAVAIFAMHQRLNSRGAASANSPK